MPALGARIRPDRDDLARLHSELGRRARTGRFRFGVPLTPPDDERSPDAQERRSVFDDHLERAERSSRDEIGSRDSLGPGLDTAMDGARVLHPARGDRARQERALARGALDQRYVGGRQSERQGQTRNPGAAAEIGNAARLPDRVELERDQGVGDMILEHLPRVADGGGGQWIGNEQLMKALQRRARRRASGSARRAPRSARPRRPAI